MCIRDRRTGALREPPTWKPRCSTSVAAGPDGLAAEVLSWGRPHERRRRYHYRWHVAGAIAAIFNRQMEEGFIDEAWAKSTLSAVFKSGKPGQVPDRSDPDNYRGIAVGNTLSKLHSIVITTRMSHWALAHGILSETQVGFLWRHSAEEHAFTLTQTVKAMCRSNKTVYALFVDFKKAYDRVHLDSMWAQLLEMGIPASLIAFLRANAAARRTSVLVNGQISEPFPVTVGVPQGDPLSCLLFILFIEPLSRYLRANTTGVRVGSVTIASLFFADDLATTNGSPAGVQHCLDLLYRACPAWGMEVGLGKGKTAAVAFNSGGCSLQLPPLRYGDASVDWDDGYRYLGYLAQSDLSEEHIAKKLIEHQRSGFYRYFTFNGTLRNSSAATQLQVYRTTTIVAVEYLRSIIALSPKTAASLDSLTASAVRNILRLPSACSSILAWCLSGMMPSSAISLRERERFRLQILLTPFADSLAAALYAALAAEPRSRRSTRGALANWAHTTEDLRDAATECGAVFLDPTSYEDISRCAHVAARSFACERLRRLLQAGRHAKHGAAYTAATLTSRPSTLGSVEHAAYITLDMRYHAQLLGTRRRSTPVSLIGPGCSGSLLALCHTGQYHAVASAALGAEAMMRWPFASNTAEERAAWDGANTYRPRVERRTCRLCLGENTMEDLYHLVCECSHASMREMQRSLLAGLPTVVRAIWYLGLEAIDADEMPRPQSHAEQYAALIQLAHGSVGALETDTQLRALVYRVLLACPFPAAAAAPGQAGLAALGELFDAMNVNSRWLRKWSLEWLRWSDRTIHRAAQAWRVANDLPAVAEMRT